LIRNWNAGEIISELQKIYFATTDPRMDGYTKRMLKNCPTYAPEDEWLEEQRLEREKEQIWRTLNDRKGLE